jgi:hypothetical protein
MIAPSDRMAILTMQRAASAAVARCCASVGALCGMPESGPCPNVPSAALTCARRHATCATWAARMSRVAPALPTFFLWDIRTLGHIGGDQ